MTVTALTALRRGRVGLHLDGSFVCALAPDDAAPLKVGDELDETRLEGLQEASNLRFARAKALTLLGTRAYSCAAIYDKLSPEYGDRAAAAAVERMLELGYLDDQDYARRLTRELTRKGLATEGIERELTRKGIDRELAREVLEEEGQDPEVAAGRLVKRRYLNTLGDPKARRRTEAALARLGYRYDVIRAVMAHLDEDEGYYDEYEA